LSGACGIWESTFLSGVYRKQAEYLLVGASGNWENTFLSGVYRKQGQYLLVTVLQEIWRVYPCQGSTGNREGIFLQGVYSKQGKLSSCQGLTCGNWEIIFLSRVYRKQGEYLLVRGLRQFGEYLLFTGLQETGTVSFCHGSTGYKIQGEYHLVRGLQEKGKMLFFSWGSMLFSGENLPRVFSKGERTCFFRSLQEPPGTGKLPSLIGVKCTFRLKLTLARLYVMLRGVLWELCLM
jgi:hypothetical protein